MTDVTSSPAARYSSPRWEYLVAAVLSTAALLFVVSVADFLSGGRERLGHMMVDSGLLSRQHFSNHQEADADRYALWLLSREFGRTNGAVEFFHKLDGRGWPSGHFAETPTMAQ